jgi:predicted RNA binding protein YcfA (HicA-like mRNA interferase family)
MPSVEKIIEKMRNQPNGIRFKEAEKVLNYLEFYETRQKGSHKRFKNTETQEAITIPEKTPLKAVYVKEILEMLGDDK